MCYTYLVRRVKNPPKTNKYFKDWFGNSKIVDKDGEPLMMYHGTSAKDFDDFKYGYIFLEDEDEDEFSIPVSFDFNSFLGPHFTDNPKIASRFAMNKFSWQHRRKENSRIIPVYLKIENPLFFDDETLMKEEILELGKNTTDERKAIEDYLTNQIGLEMGEDEFDEEFNRIVSDIDERENIIKSIEDNDEKANVMKEIGRAAKREFIQSGYDGIYYVNSIEGGIGYIPFSNSQIWWLLKLDTPKR